jgi:hypothetical protein
VSLRTQIHSAFDEVAPPTHGLPERVVQTVLTENAGRRRRERLMLRLRVPLSLVAVFMLIAVVVGVLIGGRLMQDWNSFHNPAPAAGGYQSQVAQLEAVPMRIPVFASKADCKDGPHNSEGSYGSGPIYGDGGQTSSGIWGTYFHNRAYANGNVAGPVLVRERDLFTHQPVVFVGPGAAGPVVGTDTVDGIPVEQHTELIIDTTKRSPDLGSWSGSRLHTFDWVFTAGVPTNWSGSTVWQIDGPGFSEVFVAC